MSPDTVTPEIRSRMMAGIKGRNTRPEKAVRSAIHKLGFRYRLYYGALPGTPDLVFPKYRAVVFVHGCFWHGHDCHLFKWPKTREEFWRRKILLNKERDQCQFQALTALGWRVTTIWECALKGRTRISIEEIAQRCATWLQSGTKHMELTGDETRLTT